MGYCTKCGSKIEEGKRFCSHCGTPIVEYPTYNGAANKIVEAGNNNQLYKRTNLSSKESMLPLIMGILALLLDGCTCAFFPLGFVVIIIAILGIVFGSRQNKETGSPNAKAGMIMSIIALILVWICIIVGIIVAI